MLRLVLGRNHGGSLGQSQASGGVDEKEKRKFDGKQSIWRASAIRWDVDFVEFDQGRWMGGWLPTWSEVDSWLLIQRWKFIYSSDFFLLSERSTSVLWKYHFCWNIFRLFFITSFNLFGLSFHETFLNTQLLKF